MAEAALGIAPGNPPILYAKAAPVVVSGGIGVKVPLNIGNTHETPRCNMAKSICDARITEGWRIGTRIESSRCVVGGQANLDFSKTLRDQYVGGASERGLVGNDHVGNGSCTILIGVFDNSVNWSIEVDGARSYRMENTSGTHLVELFSHMIRICQYCRIVTVYLVKGCNRAIIARDVPPMSDTSKHVEEITVGLYGRVRVAPRTTGDMEACHMMRLKIV